jgi:flagellar assembly protein FliH
MSDAPALMAACPVDVAAAMRQPSAFRARSPFMAEAGAPGLAALESAQDAFSRGLAEGQALAAISHDAERQMLLKLLASAEALQVQPCPELGQLIATAVEQLVLQIVGTMPVDATWLHDRVAEASTIIADADRDCILYLNPADVAIIGDADLGMPVHGDTQIPRGGLRIAAGDGWIEHGRPVYLDALHQALSSSGGQR